MGAPDAWRDLIERILVEQARVPVSHGQIELETVLDRRGDHYLLMAVGWDGYKRVHAPLIHLDVVDGKVWVQHDGTEAGVANDLLAGGVPQDKIVLAFQHLSRRSLGDFAVA